ncbi:MAG: hypothetical protein Kow0090_16430 [Myxococcota bacterium]
MSLVATIKGREPLFFVGTAKNSGKTTAMNALLKLYRGGRRPSPGFLSVGVDGEEKDEIYGHEKPPVYVEEGDIISTTAQALSESSCDFRVLSSPSFGSGDGRTVIAMATTGGRVLLVGADTNAQVKALVSEMFRLGAGKVFIDGAFDRRTQIALDIPVAIVLVAAPETGEDILAFAERVAATAALYRLPVRRLNKDFHLAPSELAIKKSRETIIYDTQKWRELGAEERTVAGESADEILFGGALTDSIVDTFGERIPKKLTVRDSSRIFLTKEKLRLLDEKKVKFYTSAKTTLKLVLLSSVGENNWSLSPKKAIEEVTKRLKGVPVRDIMLLVESGK